MANENPSRDRESRQQSAERSQTGSSQQGTGAHQGTNYGQGSHGSGPGSYGASGQYGQGSGRYGGSQSTSGRSGTGVATTQGGRQGGMSQGRGSSLSPFYGGGGYGSGPFSIMRRISDEMDRLFENFGMGRSLFPGQSAQGGSWDAANYDQNMTSMWSPHVEVRERGGKLVIEADLPGMKRDDINVRVEDDEVVIQGERRQETSGNQGGYYRSERSYGSFYRTIPLPEGTNADSANATFRDGVLEIEFDLPRPQQRGRTLQIREGSSASQAGTSSGATYGSGTSGSMEGASSGGTGTYGSSGAQHSASGAATGTQQSQSGTGGSAGGGVQHTSGSGTMYSGSGNPSVGAAGMGTSHAGSATDKSGDKSTS
jgi:HSP20 family protein